MENRFFSAQVLDVLLDPTRWTVFGPYCEPPVEAVSAPDHEAWMADHSHRHGHVEVMAVLQGEGHHGYRGRVYPFSPGTVFCFGPGERHDVMMPEWAPEANLLWVNVTARGFAARLMSFSRRAHGRQGQPGHLLMAEDTGLLGPNPLLHLRAIERSRPAVRPLLVRAGLELLIAAIVEHGFEPPSGDTQPRARRVIRMVEDYIHEVGGATDIHECARLAGYSRAHFLRLFKDQTGSQVKPYIDGCRLAKTAELERQGYKHRQIAEHFGMSPSSFSRWYRRMSGQQPI
ncbi:MAG TPA: hypothetical protein DGT21_21055 [Armatimonadetes bacterium]|jgi:AraC-like DNA-binding protein|nr:hypothetical protein [Armatimonadota bacterium]